MLFIPLFGWTQNVVVANTKENVLYSGLSNSLTVCVEGYKCKDLTITTDNGAIKQLDEPCNYSIKPATVGIANISVYAKAKNKIIRTVKLRVKGIPAPIALLNQKSGGTIPENILKVQLGLVAQIQNMDFESHILITGFTVLILREGKCLFVKECEGQLFPDEVKAAFSSIRTNDKIIFSSIAYRGTATSGTLQPIEFIIVD